MENTAEGIKYVMSRRGSCLVQDMLRTRSTILLSTKYIMIIYDTVHKDRDSTGILAHEHD